MLTENERLTLIDRRSRGESIRELSRSTGRSRNTVRKYLRSDGPVKRRKTALKRAEKIELFKDYILARLQDASARPSAAQLYGEIKAQGYKGGLTRVKEFVRGVKKQPPKHVPGSKEGLGAVQPSELFAPPR